MEGLPPDDELQSGSEQMDGMAASEDLVSHTDALHDFATVKKVGGDEVAKLVERIRGDVADVFEDALQQANAIVRVMGAGSPFEDVPGLGILERDFSKAQNAVDVVKKHVHRIFHATAGKAFRWLQRRSC